MRRIDIWFDRIIYAWLAIILGFMLSSSNPDVSGGTAVGLGVVAAGWVAVGFVRLIGEAADANRRVRRVWKRRRA